MTDTYSQLFDSYAHDIQWNLKKTQEDTIDRLTQRIPLSNEQKIDLTDHLTMFRYRCYEESFALGVQLGLRIAWELSEK